VLAWEGTPALTAPGAGGELQLPLLIAPAPLGPLVHPLAGVVQEEGQAVARREDAEEGEHQPRGVVEEVGRHLLRDDVGFYRVGPGGRPDLYGVYVVDSPASRGLWSEYLKILAARSEPAAKRRSRITDDLLDRVARVYRRAIEERRPPKKAVAAAEQVSEATAGRYIMRARERGHLGRTVRGKKGEIRD
jgi:hypothetical protein